MERARPLDEKLRPHDFVADFVWAVGAVFDRPAVLFMSIGFSMAPILMSTSGRHGLPFNPIVWLLAGLFGMGWIGVERMFFLYRREGKTITPGDLLFAVPGFIGRFMMLCVPLGIVVGPALMLVSHLAAAQGPATALASRLTTMRLGIIAVMLPVDLALTFVPPALVFTTRSPRDALRIGFAMIRRTWPRSALYVLCPPLALTMLNAIYPVEIPLVRVVITAGLALLALVTKGTICAFYLRERAVSFEDANKVM